MGQKTNTEDKVASGALVKRMALVLSTVWASMLLASGVALAATTTFSNSSAIQIPDSGAAIPYPSQIFVSGPNGTTITDVNLRLNGLSHTAPQDVDVILQHGNQSAIVMSDVGNAGSVNGINLTLDDEAANPLPLNDPLLSGSYKPTDIDFSSEDAAFPFPASSAPTDGSALSVFDGTDPNGIWNLFIVDDASVDSGQFVGGWSLEITTGSPDPQPDTTAPRVKSTTPQAGATGVSPTANVRAIFSEDMKSSTINATTFNLFRQGSTTKMGATLSYDATADKATLDPTNSLQRGATYKAVVSTEARDLADNSLDQRSTLSGLQQKVWFFKVRN
jgi:hypothetical protein